MGTHKIRDDKLLESQLLIGHLETPHKFLVSVIIRLPHHLKHFVAHMLRSQTQLPRNVILGQFLNEFVGMLIKEHIIKAQAAAHEHLLNPRETAQLAKHVQIIAIVHLQTSTGLRCQTALSTACAFIELLGTSRLAEVCRWTTHIVDISLEIGVLRDGLRFLDQAVLAAALNNAALMERQGAERALANTAPITG